MKVKLPNVFSRSVGYLCLSVLLAFLSRVSFAQSAGQMDVGLEPRSDLYFCFDEERSADSIQLSLVNYSQSTLNSSDISWYVNGVLSGSEHWSGMLVPGESIPLFVGSFDFTVPGNKQIKVITSSPNGTADINMQNDTLELDVFVGAGFTLPRMADVKICAGTVSALSQQTGFHSYHWSNGDTSAKVFAKSPGQYSVIVTDSFGCTFKDTAQVSFFPEPATIVDSSYAFCPDETPEVEVASSFTNVQWSTGDTGYLMNPMNAGSYQVSVTDAFGCNFESSLDVEYLKKPEIKLKDSVSVCEGDFATISIPTADLNTILWSTGESDSAIQVSNAGSYTVTVLGNNGCANSDTIDLKVSDLPIITVVGDSVVCNNTPVVLQAVTNANSVVWSSGIAAFSAEFNSGGTYQVTAQSAEGCEVVEQITIYEEHVNANLGNDTILCDGDAIAINANSSFGELMWNDGSIAPIKQIVQGGTYWVEVNGNFCSSSDTVKVETKYTPVTQFDVYVSNGTAEFTNLTSEADSYLWQFGDGNTSNDVEPIHVYANSGTYTIELQSENICGISKFEEEISVSSLGINEIGLSGNVVVYPNPATSLIQVQFSDWSGNVKASVLNALGQTILRQETTVVDQGVVQFDVSNLSSGLYYVSFRTSSQEVYTEPILVK